MTGTGSVSLQAPDGTQVTISNFKKLTDDVNGKLDKNQNLNDLPNKATARINFGLGSSAPRNVVTSLTSSKSGDVLLTGWELAANASWRQLRQKHQMAR